jgi:hypothetical protein
MRRLDAKPYIRFARANVPMKDNDTAAPANPFDNPWPMVIMT